jgi:hypothetical protein
MAFVDYSLEVGEVNGRDYPYVYNVSFKVGFAGYNCRDDVMLVQYFLKKIWERSSAPRPGGTMKVDGWMGPITDRWIRKFQSGATLKPPSPDVMVHDGIVDRAIGGTDSTEYGQKWTILALNFGFRNRYPELYDILPFAPDVPALLTSALASSFQSENTA